MISFRTFGKFAEGSESDIMSDFKNRFVRGLRVGDLSFSFPQDAIPQAQRDWLCCHSPSFEKSLIVHNMPGAEIAYVLRRRAPDGPLAKPRVMA